MAENGEAAKVQVVQRGPSDGDVLRMVVPMKVAAETFNQLQEFYKNHLVEGRDYGKVPGIDRPFLHHPGAQNLGMVYGLRPRFRINDHSDMSRRPPYIDYDVVCELYSQKEGIVRGEGVGNCNSLETKYRYRYLKPVCPVCKKEAVIKGKAEYGGGWLCHKRQGGCGRKWRAGDEAIEGQALGKVENLDVADQKNTILKMAKKRAYVDAILTTTAASGIFTEDADAVAPAAVEGEEPKAGVKKGKRAEPEPVPLAERIEKGLAAFADMGITKDTIEEYFELPADSWTEGHLEVLVDKILMIRSGAYPKEEAFVKAEPEGE